MSERIAKPLTPQQNRILEYIRTRVRTDCLPPTHDEIKHEFGLSSAFGVRQHLRLLRNKGYIDLCPGKSRGIKLAARKADDSSRLVDIPLVGRIAAGAPVLAEQNIEERISVSDSLFPNGVLFALRVRGESMIDVGIRTGDLAIIRQQATVDNGQIAAVLLGEDATLKRFHLRGDQVCLRAENKDTPDIMVKNAPGVDLRILGLYVGLIRQAR